ncbi:MAG: S-methyl-5-thioribose-1-phosphate isomerase [Phycisphaerae bacterium]|nr:S-methyl-5-thioribose-1-phosphate isomerase [Phycisphaerae bacterium]
MNTTSDIQDPRIQRGNLGVLPPTLAWVGGSQGALHVLDQTLLPLSVRMHRCDTVEQVWEAIRTLRVRGAPAIGVAAAYGLCLGTRPFCDLPPTDFLAKVRETGEYLCTCRPTAVNLAWAVRRISGVAEANALRGSGAAWEAMLVEAHAMALEDAETCRRIGEAGADLIPEGGGVLTHCNAGALATVAYGTALALLYVAHERGRQFKVYADETRPLLQGARLTAYELNAVGLDVTVLCDGAAASLMQAGRVQLVVVGADRIAANGDTANKIGTYSLALAARHHGIPFYVAAPLSTFDRSLRSGKEIPIEERPEDEVRCAFGKPFVPPKVPCHNPAFDVTPAALLTGIVTEKGVLEPVTEAVITIFFDKRG